MTDPPDQYRIERLAETHNRTSFKSGVEPLDRYLQSQASQDVRRRIATCFVAVPPESQTVCGFYTIAATSVPLGEIAAETVKKLPRYALIPAVRIGRLAVDMAHRGRGLGISLLVDSMKRALRADIMAFALVVDAKDDVAAKFYLHHGFIAFMSQPLSFYLPLADAAKQYSSAKE